MFLKLIECNIIRYQTHKKFLKKDRTLLLQAKNNSGFSLLEVLMSLFLLSVTSILFMHFQMRVLRQSRYLSLYHTSHLAQVSLAERLRSCGTNKVCQQHELVQWQQTIKNEYPLLNAEIIASNHHYQVPIKVMHVNQTVLLEFIV